LKFLQPLQDLELALQSGRFSLSLEGRSLGLNFLERPCAGGHGQNENH
jgi:hypothetical protein